MNDYCVYKHTVPNGKVYIGITKVNPLNRWGNGHGYKDNKKFFSDIVKYGWVNITHEILYDGLTESEARRKESELICSLQTYDSKYGYNIQRGLRYGFISINRMNRDDYLQYCKTDDYRQKCKPKRMVKRPVSQFTTEGVFIATYDSITKAANMTGCCRYGIRDCLKGLQKTAGGFCWIDTPRALIN